METISVTATTAPEVDAYLKEKAAERRALAGAVARHLASLINARPRPLRCVDRRRLALSRQVGARR